MSAVLGMVALNRSDRIYASFNVLNSDPGVGFSIASASILAASAEVSDEDVVGMLM